MSSRNSRICDLASVGHHVRMARRSERPTDPNGLRLFLTRDALGFADNQAAFARRAGLLPHTYNPFEKGKRRLTQDAAQKLCNGFPQLDFGWLFHAKHGQLPHDLVVKLMALGAIGPAVTTPPSPQPKRPSKPKTATAIDTKRGRS